MIYWIILIIGEWLYVILIVEDFILSKTESIITIGSLGIAPAWYLWKRNKEQKAERKQASENIYRELEDTEESLDGDLYKEYAIQVKDSNGKEIYYMNRKLNNDFYDSLIYSGKINYLKPELQQQVQNIFSRIKDHNKFLELVRTMQDATPDNSIPEKAFKYYEWLDLNEVILLKDIPLMKKKLKEEFKITHQ